MKTDPSTRISRNFALLRYKIKYLSKSYYSREILGRDDKDCPLRSEFLK